MFSASTALLVILIYVGLLFALAQWVERRIANGRSRFSSAWIYALSQAVFFTSWTFYGSVGFAVEKGLGFFGIYVGAMLGMACAGVLLRRMVRAKEAFHITSLADFIATRYNHSQRIAALVTLIALVGLLPYLALQLTAIVNAFAVISGTPGQHDWNLTGALITLVMILFTLIFGVRRLDPTERHQGMIVALVAECLVKLAAFLIIGIFTTYVLFNGPGDLLDQARQHDLGYLLQLQHPGHSNIDWITQIALGFAAIYCLPRQFHVAVVENSNRKHIRHVLWSFPLYTLLISLFVIPITAAGLILGLPAARGDQFMLLIPQIANSPSMTLISFLGGFSAATGMLLITTLALATMASNHLVLPALRLLAPGNRLGRHLLQLRWALVTLILATGYLLARILGDSYALVSIGLISFAAILQFAPALLLGMVWRRGNSKGALLGLLAGFLIWAYTLVLPAWVELGWLPALWLQQGPFGIAALHPQQLFGITGMPPLTHSVFWSLLANTSLYVLTSLLLRPSKSERQLTREVMVCLRGGVRPRAGATGLNNYIELKPKLHEAESVLRKYLHPEKISAMLGQIGDDLQISGKERITIVELMELHRMVEHLLAGSIGAAAAHAAMRDGIRYSERESADLKTLFSHLVSELNPEPQASSPSQPANAGAGYDLLIKLQRSIDELAQQNAGQTQLITNLQTRLDDQYQQIFNLRMETQRLRVENEQLRAQSLTSAPTQE